MSKREKIKEETKELVRESALPYELLAELYNLSVNQVKYIKSKKLTPPPITN